MSRTNYQIGDFLIRIKNASMARNKEVTVQTSKKLVSLANGLKKMGYLENVKIEKDLLKVSLAFKNKTPVLQDVKLISKPGLRVYKSVAEIEEKKSPAQYLISSPKGIISTREALKLRVGGEVIAEIL